MATWALVELMTKNGVGRYDPPVWWTGKFVSGGHEWTNNLFDAKRFQHEHDAQDKLAALEGLAQSKPVDPIRLRFVEVDFEQFP